MCLVMPGRVVEIEGSTALVDGDGRRHRVSTLFVPEVTTGDWVIVLAGTVLRRVPEAEACEIRAAISTASAGGTAG